jgi:hypothetical protein
MLSFLCSAFLVAGLATASVMADQRENAPSTKVAEFNAETLYALVEATGPLVLQDDWSDGLTTEQRWHKTLRDWGLKPTSRGIREEMWNLTDSSGEIRVEAVFLTEEVRFWISFYPAERVRVPDALLAQPLKMADKTTLIGGNSIDVAFPRRPLSNDGKSVNRCEGSKDESMTLRLAGGVLVNQLKVLKCATAARP